MDERLACTQKERNQEGWEIFLIIKVEQKEAVNLCNSNLAF